MMQMSSRNISFPAKVYILSSIWLYPSKRAYHAIHAIGMIPQHPKKYDNLSLATEGTYKIMKIMHCRCNDLGRQTVLSKVHLKKKKNIFCDWRIRS